MGLLSKSKGITFSTLGSRSQTPRTPGTQATCTLDCSCRLMASMAEDAPAVADEPRAEDKNPHQTASGRKRADCMSRFRLPAAEVACASVDRRSSSGRRMGADRNSFCSHCGDVVCSPGPWMLPWPHRRSAGLASWARRWIEPKSWTLPKASTSHCNGFRVGPPARSPSSVGWLVFLMALSMC